MHACNSTNTHCHYDTELTNLKISNIVEELLNAHFSKYDLNVSGIQEEVSQTVNKLKDMQDALNEHITSMPNILNNFTTLEEFYIVKKRLDNLIQAQDNELNYLKDLINNKLNSNTMQFNQKIDKLKADNEKAFNSVFKEIENLKPVRDAYNIAKFSGFEGTEAEWLESLKGKSAYEIAVDNGYIGSEVDWLSYIVDTTEVAQQINEIPLKIKNAIDNTAIEEADLVDTFVTVTKHGNTVARTQRDKNSDRFSIKDYGATGLGIVDDSEAFRRAPDNIYIPAGTYKLDNDALGRKVILDDNVKIIGNYAESVRTVEKYENKVPIRGMRNVLFIGDSLTEKRDNSSYSWYVANHLAHRHGGYSHIGYIPFSSYRTKQDLGNITLINSGFTEMFGNSDHKWDQFPYKHSPDGKGWYVENAVGNETIRIQLAKNLRFFRIKLYVLANSNGGTFNVTMPLTSAKDKHVLNTGSARTEVKVLTINHRIAEDFSEIVIDNLEAGKDYYFYGIELLDNTNLTGFSYNVFARNGIFARDFANLIDISTYAEELGPDTVLINLGTNDVINNRSIEDYKNDMITLINRIKQGAEGTQIIIVEPNETKYFPISSRHHQFAIARKDIAKQVGGYYIDVPAIVGNYRFFTDSGYMTSDSIHPNAIGKKAIAEGIISGLNIVVSQTALYFPQETNRSHLHNFNLGRYQSLPMNNKIKLVTFGLIGDYATTYLEMDIVAFHENTCVTKKVRVYFRKYASWQSNSVSVIDNVVIEDLYKIPQDSEVSFDVFIEQDGTKASLYVTMRGFSATTWSIEGKYTSKYSIPKNSGIVLEA